MGKFTQILRDSFRNTDGGVRDLIDEQVQSSAHIRKITGRTWSEKPRGVVIPDGYKAQEQPNGQWKIVKK